MQHMRESPGLLAASCVMNDSGCRIYLVLPPNAGEAFAGPLTEALSPGNIACLLLETGGGRLNDRQTAARLMEICHHHDVAILIEDDAAAAHELGADGIHLSRKYTADEAAYKLARDLLGTDAIIGGDCGVSRHRAMVLGEQGADYVAFSTAAHEPGKDGATANDMISWWSELVEVPCVAWRIAGVAEAETAARQGADFVALDAGIWRNLSTAPQTIKAIHDHLNAINPRG